MRSFVKGLWLAVALLVGSSSADAREKAREKNAEPAGEEKLKSFDGRFEGLEFRCIGPYRGGRSIAVARPSQNLGGDDMCSAIHLPLAQGST